MSQNPKRLLFWKHINQTITKTPLTPHALKRKLKLSAKVIGILGSGLAVVGLIYVFYQSTSTGALMTCFKPEQSLIQSIEYTTNGVLTKNWILQQTALNKKADIMDISIFDLKNQLEANTQIKKATIERVFPASIRISIQERVPALRVAIQKDRQAKPSIFLISKEGFIYEGACYPDYVLKKLPFADGIRIQKSGKDFELIRGMPVISELLYKAYTYKPHLYANWKIVSLKKFDPDSMQNWSVIKIVTRDDKEITFAADAFMEQLEHLDHILQVVPGHQLAAMKSIDLSLKGEVTVQFLDAASLRTKMYGSRGFNNRNIHTLTER
jgi:cell division septal protein FtsQ